MARLSPFPLLFSPLQGGASAAPDPLPTIESLGDALEDEQALHAAHDDLMQTILDEEEELIAAHKRQIEETMNTVRKEMALVQEVDQPGSAIDKYVAGLSTVLAAKAASIADLQARWSRRQLRRRRGKKWERVACIQRTQPGYLCLSASWCSAALVLIISERDLFSSSPVLLSQARLATFQRHLREEEILSRTVSGANRGFGS